MKIVVVDDSVDPECPPDMVYVMSASKVLAGYERKSVEDEKTERD